MPGVVVQACNPSTGKEKMGGSMDFADQLVLWIYKLQFQWQAISQKIRQKIEKDTQCWPLASTHNCPYISQIVQMYS